jgi:hypothetical protein
MPKRRARPAIASTRCTTRCGVATYWRLPMVAALPTKGHPGWMARRSTTSRRTGGSDGWTSWRKNSARKRIVRRPYVGFSSLTLRLPALADDFRLESLTYGEMPPCAAAIPGKVSPRSRDLQICLDKGDIVPVNWLDVGDLKGPRAFSVSLANTRGARVSPTIVQVAAGKTHWVPITTLEFYCGRTTQTCYWTKAGECTLVVSCGVVEGGEKGFWQAAG